MKKFLRSSVLLLAPLLAGAAESAKRPNILVAIADDWSFPHATAYGTSWVKTPAFDRVAREGVLFRNCYTPVAKCSASRATVVTGRNPWQLEAGFTHWSYFPPNYRSYAEALAAAGYFTGFTGKGWGPGTAAKADGSPRNLLGRAWQAKKIRKPTTGISNIDYASNFADFLAAAPKDQPWCFWYGAHEPHRDYEYGSGVAKGGKKTSDIDRVPGFLPDEERVRNDLLDYAFEVEHFDHHLARILELLAERGELDNTLVIVTGDNGMPFPRGKGQNYEIACHLPLAIRWPAHTGTAGRTLDDYVSFIDLAPTMLAAAGVDWSAAGMSPTPGRSVLPLLESKKSPRADPSRDHLLLGRERHDAGRPHNQGYPIRAIVRDGWLYLHNFATDRWPAGNPETGYLDVDSSPSKTAVLQRHRADPSDRFWALAFGLRGADELYDLAKDPDCIVNLAGVPAHTAREAALHDQLFAELRAQNDPRLTGPDPDIFDKYPSASPVARDLYERWKAGERLPARAIADADPNPLEKR